MAKLSICISTYNRAQYLSDCIKSLLDSIDGYQLDIEVVISNNGSVDNTEEILNNIKAANSFIKIHKHEKNIGGDANFYFLAGYACGEYIWIFGDDDKFEKSAILYVMNEINQDYSHIIVNYSMYSKDLNIRFNEKFFKFKQDLIFTSANKLLKDFSITLGYTSCVILKRELFLSTPYPIYKSLIEFGTSFNYAVYYTATKRCNIKYIAVPLVKYRGYNIPVFQDLQLWYKYFTTGSSLLFNKLRIKGYSDSAIYSAENIVLKEYIMHDISFRKRNGEELVGIFNLIYPYYKYHVLFWFVIVPMIFAPKFTLVFVNKIVIFFRKIFHK